MSGVSQFDESIADRICELITEGESVLAISAKPDFPAQSTIYKWLIQNPTFAEKYARAREAQADYYAEEILAIADETQFDTITIKRGDSETEVANNEWINRSRLRVDTRKWLMGKLKPKVYGEKLQNTHSDPDGGPIQFVAKSILEK